MIGCIYCHTQLDRDGKCHRCDGKKESDALLVAAAIAREGFPRDRETAHDYRIRLAHAAIAAMPR